MFFHCYALKSIEFPETFNTSLVTTMDAMFSHCKSLTTLNLSLFDTSRVTIMSYMFNNCFNLKYLNIPNFITLNLTKMPMMFFNLSSLIYLNIYSLEINNNTDMSSTFSSPSPYLKICANQNQMKAYLSTLSYITYNNCSDICFNPNIKLDIGKNECIISCKDNGYQFEYNNICYNQCPENTHYVNSDEDVLLCFDKNPEGYYLYSQLYYLKCFESCKFCYGEGNKQNNNCKECKSDYIFINETLYSKNCYKPCQNYYYFNETDDYICTENCLGIYDKFITEKKKCIDNCQNDDTYKYEYNKICYIKCPNGTIYSEFDEICIEIINLDNYSSKINLVIITRGIQSFLNDSFYLEPSVVIINGKIKKSCRKVCEFEYEENDVTLYFNNSLESCEYMFSGRNNIKEIDLSNFDFSVVTSMKDMFRYCTILIKIEFGNINTSSVLNMEYLFYNCTSLSFINVSNFDTSSVTTMNRMFTYCYKLTTIDISNFNLL